MCGQCAIVVCGYDHSGIPSGMRTHQLCLAVSCELCGPVEIHVFVLNEWACDTHAGV